MKFKKMVISLVFLLVISVTMAFSGNVINNKLPEFPKDIQSETVKPIVVYNPTTQNYETIYLNIDKDGNLGITKSDTIDKTSTGSAGKLSETGSITADFNVIDYTFYADGGEAKLTMDFIPGDTAYVPNGTSLTGRCEPAYNNPTITVESLEKGTTLYYSITGNE